MPTKLISEDQYPKAKEIVCGLRYEVALKIYKEVSRRARSLRVEDLLSDITLTREDIGHIGDDIVPGTTIRFQERYETGDMVIGYSHVSSDSSGKINTKTGSLIELQTFTFNLYDGVGNTPEERLAYLRGYNVDDERTKPSVYIEKDPFSED